MAAVAECGLSLAKLYEGHTDAIAILHELQSPFAVGRGSALGMRPNLPMDTRSLNRRRGPDVHALQEMLVLGRSGSQPWLAHCAVRRRPRAEALDERVIVAAQRLGEEDLADPILLENIESSSRLDAYAAAYLQARPDTNPRIAGRLAAKPCSTPV